MKMSIDEARTCNAITSIDDLRVRSAEIRPDGDQGTVTHVHVAIGDVTQLWVHRDDVSVAHDELAARRQLAGSAICSPEARCLPGIGRAGG